MNVGRRLPHTLVIDKTADHLSFTDLHRKLHELTFVEAAGVAWYQCSCGYETESSANPFVACEGAMNHYLERMGWGAVDPEPSA